MLHLEMVPRLEPIAEPVSTIGASAPTEPPKPMVMETGYDGRPSVMSFDASLPPRDGVWDFGNTMTDVVLHHVADKQSGQEDTHYRMTR